MTKINLKLIAIIKIIAEEIIRILSENKFSREKEFNKVLPQNKPVLLSQKEHIFSRLTNSFVIRICVTTQYWKSIL